MTIVDSSPLISCSTVTSLGNLNDYYTVSIILMFKNKKEKKRHLNFIVSSFIIPSIECYRHSPYQIYGTAMLLVSKITAFFSLTLNYFLSTILYVKFPLPIIIYQKLRRV